jgi:hypothetical protein
MRWLPKAIQFLIAIIVIDLAMVFGIEAFRIFTSASYGLDRLAFANTVHAIGALAGWKAQGLFNVAAFLGAVHLTIAVVLTLHLASRVRALRGGRIAHDLLDAGLILVVASTVVVSTPAILNGATEILVQERLPLWLVGLAATLSIIERLPEAEAARPGLFERLCARLAARLQSDETLVLSPARRNKSEAARWDELRNDAGMVIAPSAPRAPGPWFSLH